MMSNRPKLRTIRWRAFASLWAVAAGIGPAIAVSEAVAAEAQPHCMTRILADVPAAEAPDQVKSKSNGEFGPVTKIKVNRETGRMLLCAENSYCYNSNAFEFITPCRIKIDKEGAGFDNYFYYFTR